MGVNLWGESPLYENRKVFMLMDTNKSTSRRQGRLREEGSGGSRSANVRGDEQKPHIRLSPWASRHNTSEAHRFGDRVNAAFVHGKFTSLSGEICVSRDKRFMSLLPERSIRLTNDPAYLPAVSGYEPSWGTRNPQQLMICPVAPCMATCRVSTQKSADGIVPPADRREGPNVEVRGVFISSHAAMTPSGGAL
jgi:hypothetical protein